MEHYLLILTILSYFHCLVDFQVPLFQVVEGVPTSLPNSEEVLEELDCLLQKAHFLALVEVQVQVRLLEVAQVVVVHQEVVGQNSMVAYSRMMIQSHLTMMVKLLKNYYLNYHYFLLQEEVVEVHLRTHSS